MAGVQERRSHKLIFFRKGRGIWVLAAIAAVILLLIFMGLGSPEGSDVSFRNLTSLENVGTVVSNTFSDNLQPSAEKVPPTVQNQVEALFAEIKKNPDEKEALLRELKHVLQQNFKGQEDCWSCPGSEYFDRFDAIAGHQESRKPSSLKEWIAMGDEAFDNQRLDEAREKYSEALQIIDERVFQPDEKIDTDSLNRLTERCQQLNCR